MVEGWYGQPYPKPLARTREYIEIIRRVLAREEPLDFQGEHYQVPNRGPGTMELGKPLKSITHPRRADLPILLGAEGPKNVAMAAEIADGWLPIFLSPKLDEHYRECLAEGFARPGARRTMDDFEIPNMVTSSSTTTSRRPPTSCACRSASTSAGWAPGRSTSTPTCSPAWATATRSRRSRTCSSPAARTRPSSGCRSPLVEDVALVGPLDKVREELDEKWRKTSMTTLLVSGSPTTSAGGRPRPGLSRSDPGVSSRRRRRRRRTPFATAALVVPDALGAGVACLGDPDGGDDAREHGQRGQRHHEPGERRRSGGRPGSVRDRSSLRQPRDDRDRDGGDEEQGHQRSGLVGELYVPFDERAFLTVRLQVLAGPHRQLHADDADRGADGGDRKQPAAPSGTNSATRAPIVASGTSTTGTWTSRGWAGRPNRSLGTTSAMSISVGSPRSLSSSP